MLFGNLTPQLVEIDVFLGLHRVSTGLILLDEGVRNVGASAQESLIFREQFAPLCQGLWLHRHRGGRHGENFRVRNDQVVVGRRAVCDKENNTLNRTKEAQRLISSRGMVVARVWPIRQVMSNRSIKIDQAGPIKSKRPTASGATA